MLVSVVIPVLNDAEFLENNLRTLQQWRGEDLEIIVVDGGSKDGSINIARQLADRVLQVPRGRAVQMNEGARAATGNIFLFVHADTLLPTAFADVINQWKNECPYWGFFSVRLSGGSFWFQVIAACMNLRSKFTKVATGDQCLFVERNLFFPLGGYEQLPIMEDVALCKQLRKMFKPQILPQTVVTSSRQWKDRGIVAAILLMWWLRLLYFLGVSPRKLVKRYYPSH